jgi:hypothetical protein
VKNKSHLSKVINAATMEELIAGESPKAAPVPLTVIEYDHDHMILWKNLRSCMSSRAPEIIRPRARTSSSSPRLQRSSSNARRSYSTDDDNMNEFRMSGKASEVMFSNDNQVYPAEDRDDDLMAEANQSSIAYDDYDDAGNELRLGNDSDYNEAFDQNLADEFNDMTDLQDVPEVLDDDGYDERIEYANEADDEEKGIQDGDGDSTEEGRSKSLTKYRLSVEDDILAARAKEAPNPTSESESAVKDALAEDDEDDEDDVDADEGDEDENDVDEDEVNNNEDDEADEEDEKNDVPEDEDSPDQVEEKLEVEDAKQSEPSKAEDAADY